MTPKTSRRATSPLLLKAIESEQAKAAVALRSETAQVLTTVLVGLAAASLSEDLDQIRVLLRNLGDSVRTGLGRTLEGAMRNACRHECAKRITLSRLCIHRLSCNSRSATTVEALT